MLRKNESLPRERERSKVFLRQHSHCYWNLRDVTGGGILKTDNLSLLQMFERILVIDTQKMCDEKRDLF